MWSAGSDRPSLSRPGVPQGFALVELLVVLVIIGLVLAVTPPLLSSALPGTQLKSAARELGAALRYARDHAIIAGREAVFELDVERHSYQVTGRQRTFELPEGLDLKLDTAASEISADGVGNIRFFPDGSSTGGRVTLAYKTRAYEVDVDWLTGRVRILD